MSQTNAIPLRLVVGLGNPGTEYEDHRHNVGAWFVQALAKRFHVSLKRESKLQASLVLLPNVSPTCWLAIPTQYMNLSGQAVAAVAKYYQIAPESILIVHDELDFPPGQVRVKCGGGHGGHNGLRSILQQLGSDQFYRLRIGIGHPGNRDEVSDYVLSKPNGSDRKLIEKNIENALDQFDFMIVGEWAKVMQQLHC